jgi:hypothetical protein
MSMPRPHEMNGVFGTHRVSGGITLPAMLERPGSSEATSDFAHPTGLGRRSAASPGTRRGRSAPSARRTRSPWALSLGVTSTSPSARNTASKLRENLASRSRSTKRTCRPPSPSTSSRLRACWATQAPLGLAVTPAKWPRLVSCSMKHSCEDLVGVLPAGLTPSTAGLVPCI